MNGGVKMIDAAAGFFGIPREAVIPLLAILIAILSAGISYRSLRVNRKTARRRAAVDVFVKTEMDQTLIRAFDEFRLARTALEAQPDMEAFVVTEHLPSDPNLSKHP